MKFNLVDRIEHLSDERIVAVCNDSVGSSNLVGFREEFPDRLFNVIEAKRLSATAAFTTDDGSFGTPGKVTDVMERMLTPDEDPAIAYWRWWITATLEGTSLRAGDVVRRRRTERHPSAGAKRAVS